VTTRQSREPAFSLVQLRLPLTYHSIMALRRSSRSASAKPLSKSGSNSRTNGTKRPVSPEPSVMPLPKRSRSVSQKPENDPPVADSRRKPNSRSALVEDSAQPATSKKSRKLSPIHEAPPAPKQLKPYFNPLPVPPQKHRPGLLPFVWGTGNFGQFGMGPEVLGEVSKPRRNTWIEERIEDGAFGEDNAGIESVACGGLHTIFLDEKGTVSQPQRSPLIIFSSSLPSYGHVVLMTTLPLDGLRKMSQILKTPVLS
jgi:regulator of chromosome condensation